MQLQIAEIDQTLSQIKLVESEVRADLEELQSELVREQDALTKDTKESQAELRKHETDKETLEHFADCSAEGIAIIG